MAWGREGGGKADVGGSSGVEEIDWRLVFTTFRDAGGGLDVPPRDLDRECDAGPMDGER